MPSAFFFLSSPSQRRYGKAPREHLQMALGKQSAVSLESSLLTYQATMIAHRTTLKSGIAELRRCVKENRLLIGLFRNWLRFIIVLFR